VFLVVFPTFSLVNTFSSRFCVGISTRVVHVVAVTKISLFKVLLQELVLGTPEYLPVILAHPILDFGDFYDRFFAC
jgi:hypothetical protein